MNKRMRELLALIDQKTAEARGYMDGENKDVSKASEILDEVDALKKEYETEKRLVEDEKKEVAPIAEAKKTTRTREEAIKALGKAAKQRFRGNEKDLTGILNETSDPAGGYTVPEDIRTIINEYKEAEFSFLPYIRNEVVGTDSGRRTFKKRAQYTGFSLVGEGAAIGAAQTPQFEPLSYAIKKYAGYLPVTNELRADSDANIGAFVAEWLAKESVATVNTLVLAKLTAGTAENLNDLDGIKNALNVTLGSAFKATSVIVTNDDGLQYLDTLKDSNERYLLTPVPSEPGKLQLAVGAVAVPVVVAPNAIMASVPTYSASTDTTVQAGKDYYTLSGGVYTKVANPTGNPSTSSYYEMDPTPQIPFIIGDLNEAIVRFDRQQMTIAESQIASIGSLNAFEQDLTIFRAIEREDVVVRDDDAFVYGYIQPSGE